MKHYLLTMNKKQRITLSAGFILILITATVWAIQGFYLFTHDKMMIQLPQSDIEKMLEQPPRFTWVNHFTLGLEYTLLFTAIVITICAILFILFKNRKAI